MAETKDVRDQATVQAWLRGLQEQWGEAPGDWDRRVEALSDFCDFVDKDPDTVINECVRESGSEKRISVKGRRYYSEKIVEWQSSLKGERSARAWSGNAVRSFLIHNGIFIQGGLQT